MNNALNTVKALKRIDFRLSKLQIIIITKQTKKYITFPSKIFKERCTQCEENGLRRA